MIIKHHKGFNAVILGIVISVIVAVFTFNSTNFRIIIEDLRESFFAYDLGVSRLISWEHGADYSKRFQYAFTRIPTILYKNIVGFERQDFGEFFIHVDFEDYQKILRDRADAIQLGLLRDPTEVNAMIEYNGDRYEAKVRLKGDYPDHWLSQYRMSLRVNLKSDKTIFGLNEFSIQKPRSREFPHDAIFQETARDIGLLATKHKYAKVNFNGKYWGVMNVESHISTEFLEAEGRKDSIVVRFSNEDGWLYSSNTNNVDYDYRISDPVIYTKLFNTTKKLKDEINRARFSYIVNQRLLGESHLYNTNSYIDILLLSHIWGGKHVLYENNIKHYLNPYTLKLEVISSDQIPPQENNIRGCGTLDFGFASSNTYKNLDKKHLSALSLKERFHNIRNIVLPNIDSIIKSQQKIFPLDNPISSELIKRNIELMNNDNFESFIDRVVCSEPKSNPNVFDPLNYLYHVYAHHYSNGKVEIFNLLKDEVKILYIKDMFGTQYSIDTVIPGYIDQDYSSTIVKTNFVGNYDSQLFIVTSYKGEEKVTPLLVTLTDKGAYNPLVFKTPDNFEFLHKRDKKDWFISKGVWVINNPIVIQGNLTIEKGTTLKFNESSYLIVNGRLTSTAPEGEKITLSSSGDSWGGLYVYESSSESKLKNMIISNTSSIKDGILNLTGGVTFYNADVSMENVEFLNSMSEDMLNIVNSKYFLKNITMNKALSDAIDFDFSEGSIDNINIFDVGGDALDFSGSTSKVSNANIVNVKDKAFSVGEESYVNIKKSRISNVGVGVASKDGSLVNVLNTSFKDITLSPAMTFIKKSFYGPPQLLLQSCDIDVNSNLIAQTGTSISVDGIHIETQDVNVEKLYQSNVMKNE